MNLVWTTFALAVPIVVNSEWYEENGCDKYMPWKMKEMLGCIPTCDEIETVLAECLSSATPGMGCPDVSVQSLDLVASRAESLCCDDFDEYLSNCKFSCHSCSNELTVWETCVKESESFQCVEKCESEESLPDPDENLEDYTTTEASTTDWGWGELNDEIDFNRDGANFGEDEAQALLNNILDTYNAAHSFGTMPPILCISGSLAAIFSYWLLV